MLKVSDIAAMTGYSASWVRQQAALGNIDGAYRATETAQWRFDEIVVKAWWASKQQGKKQWHPYTSAAKSTGAALNATTVFSDEALKQLLNKKPKDVFPSGKMNSTRNSGATDPGQNILTL